MNLLEDSSPAPRRTLRDVDAARLRPGPSASRIVVGGMVTAAFVGLAWADAIGLGGAAAAWWLLPLAVALAVGGVGELTMLFMAQGIHARAWLLRPAVVAVVLATAGGAGAFAVTFSTASPAAAMGWSAAAFAVSCICLAAVEIATYRPGAAALPRLAAGIFSLAFVGLPLAFVVGLRLLCVENLGPEQLGPGHLGIVPLASLVAVTKAGDIAAYGVGSLVGRHRMAPHLSPGKTWEGAIASLAGSMLASWTILEFTPGIEGSGPWGGWGAFGLLVGIAGMLGDLAESLVKRECGAKDSGRSLGALGGILDLIDSLLFAAPVAWLLWLAAAR